MLLCLALSACGTEDDSDLEEPGSLFDASQPVTVGDAGVLADAAPRDAAGPVQDTGSVIPQDSAVAPLDANTTLPEASLDAALDAAPADATTPGDAIVPNDARAQDASGDGAAGSCATLTYQSFGQQFLSMYCTSCHTGASAQRGIMLDTLAGVQKNKVAIRRQAVAGTAMPPRAPRPMTADRQKLGQWLDCGPN
jgi:hypothetical protein